MIYKSEFGIYQGNTIYKYTLVKGRVEVDLINLGATLTGIRVPDKDGKMTEVALGYNTVDEFARYDGYFGASIGRIANRISGASFNYNGKEYKLFANDGNINTLHGGKEGFDKKVWNSEIVGESVVMTYSSPDGEEGFFGNLDVEVEFFIDDDNGVNIVYTAVTDTESAVNLTNHVYFNLNGEGSGTVTNHKMQINSSCITCNDTTLVPTGEYMDVAGTPFDFRSMKTVGDGIDCDHPQIKVGHGYDHNFVLDIKDVNDLAAVTVGDKSGIVMETYTNQNGLQFYSGNLLTLRMGKGGKLYDFRDAFCLEAQAFPNSLNIPAFGSPIIRSGEVYRNTIKYRFSTVK